MGAAVHKQVTAAGGAGITGLAIGFLADPAKGLKVFEEVNKSLGPVGFVAVLALGFSVVANCLMWTRLKEKDEECRKQEETNETRWSNRFLELRADTKEAFATVTILTKQVTLLAERMGVMMGSPTRGINFGKPTTSSTDSSSG